MVEQMDLCVGRIMAYLADPNGDGDRADSTVANTLVIFYSDNGGGRGSTRNTPLRGAKGMFTEGGIRVPLIAHMPATVPAGTTNDTPVNMVNIFPTLADFSGANLPDAKQQPLDEMSLRPLLTGRVQSLGQRSLCWHFPGYLDDRAEPTSVIIREVEGKRYKLLYFYETQKWALYNLTDDLAESTDLLDAGKEESFRSVLSLLSKDLRGWLDQTGAIYPVERSTGKTVFPPEPWK